MRLQRLHNLKKKKKKNRSCLHTILLVCAATPFGFMPVLKVGGGPTLTESLVVAQYVAEEHGECGINRMYSMKSCQNNVFFCRWRREAVDSCMRRCSTDQRRTCVSNHGPTL